MIHLDQSVQLSPMGGHKSRVKALGEPLIAPALLLQSERLVLLLHMNQILAIRFKMDSYYNIFLI